MLSARKVNGRVIRVRAPLWTAAGGKRRAVGASGAQPEKSSAKRERTKRKTAVAGPVSRVFAEKKRYKPGRVPRFWRSLTRPLSGGAPVSESRLNGWLLVLAAKKVPHIFFPSRTFPGIYVPPLWEGVALHEIRAFEAERPAPVFQPPVRDNAGSVLFILLFLLVWHGLRWGWFSYRLPVPPFPAAPGDWAAAFGLDVYRTVSLHEWWRTLTALTLHADDKHLLSNLAFGVFFFIPLCRRAGLGFGFALALGAGICGNAANALTRDFSALSIGFSTALFGAMGALCALSGADILRHSMRLGRARRSRDRATHGSRMLVELGRRVMLPLAAGLALLGFLGGGGEARTDYAAHIWGFVWGVLLTLLSLPLERRIFSLPEKTQKLAQTFLLASCLLLSVLVWRYALLRTVQ